MQQIEVKVENDHIQRITTAKPISTISELIWNAYDADAREIKVELEEGQLTRLGVIRIVDDGTGIPADEVETCFQSLGGSWKKRTVKTKSGRSIHGEKGQGRFKAFALGDRVTWVSRHAGKSFQSVATNRT
ncbi:ATP-binding protein [Neorhizobium sp. Rsf11]|uniref:ATP-binding protein n=1 Tax=Neorhizobium phenanthreniclasticum TaxID=3157917 RepID=A0ABV0M6T5_9HYPH